MSIPHTDVGAYALGLLEPDDTLAFEEHLRDCDSCAAEVSEFSGMRDLFAGVEAVEPLIEEPMELPGDITHLIHRKRRAEHRQRRGTFVLSAAASVAILAGGITAGSAITRHVHGSPAADLLARGEQHAVTDPTSHATGTVALEKATWGTEIALDLSNVRGPLTCRLIAVTRSGGQQTVTEWAVAPKGYGVPGSPDHLQVHGGAAAQRQDITRLEVQIENGGDLVTIPV